MVVWTAITVGTRIRQQCRRSNSDASGTEHAQCGAVTSRVLLLLQLLRFCDRQVITCTDSRRGSCCQWLTQSVQEALHYTAGGSGRDSPSSVVSTRLVPAGHLHRTCLAALG